MRARSRAQLASVAFVLALGGCVQPYEPILICHNSNCAGTGNHEDDTVESLQESLSLRTDGMPTIDGVEIDTFLYWDGAESKCLYAHDDGSPDVSPSPQAAAEVIAAHLQQDTPAWNGQRFYLKVELKPTVAGSDLYHTGPQLQQHAECVLDMAITATQGTRHPVTVIFDNTAECLQNELEYRLAEEPYATLAAREDIGILFSGPIVPERECIPAALDLRTFFVYALKDTEIESLRPVMVWMRPGDENSETLNILEHLRPEYMAISEARYVRGWLNGQK